MVNPIQATIDFLRFSRSYKQFSQRSISLDEAHNQVQSRLSRQGAIFLQVVERNVFQHKRSPYLPLFEMAGCEFGDLTQMIESAGLDNTLLELRRNGVYFSFEEYKGRQHVVRNGKEIPIKPADFDNAAYTGGMEGESGGSTGDPTRYYIDFVHIADAAAAVMLAMDAHSVIGAPVGIWMTVLPYASGPSSLLRFAHSGHVPQKWFANITTVSETRNRMKSTLYNQALVSLGRLYGLPIPSPEPLSLDQALVAAQWVSNTIKLHGKCVLFGQVSKGLRVALAAIDAGLDLTGATFLLGGEPITVAKVSTISRCGAVCVPVYAFSEHGIIGMGCTDPTSEDEVHLFDDRIAVIQYPREVAGHGIVVDSFHWTSLSKSAPKVMINVESDDYGIVEERSCGCPLGSCGFTKLIRNIRSFSKMTAESLTLVGTSVVHVLEEILPARFGGSLLDYQLAEDEDDNGITRVYLIVDPKIQIDNENDVIKTFVEATAHEPVRDLWLPAGTLKVKRMKPLLTGHGKLMPLQLSGASTTRRSTSG